MPHGDAFDVSAMDIVCKVPSLQCQKHRASALLQGVAMMAMQEKADQCVCSNRPSFGNKPQAQFDSGCSCYTRATLVMRHCLYSTSCDTK